MESLSYETLIRFYRKMVLLRQLDQKAINLQRTGKLGTCSTIAGHEAIDTVASHYLKESDVFVPYYRDHGILLSRGYGISDFLAYWSGNEWSSNAPNNSDLPICVPIGTQYTQACGVASAIKYRNQKSMVLVTGGDGGSAAKGDFTEALNVAGVWKLPIVFLVKNNQYAITTPIRKETAGKISDKGIGAGVYSVRVDGNNVFALSDVMSKAFHKARNNKGPTLIEAVCYRLGDHTTVDHSLSYRSAEEVNCAMKDDPVLKLRNHLVDSKIWDSENELKLSREVKAIIEDGVEKYFTYKNSSLDDLFDYTLEDNAHLTKQKNEARKFFKESH